MNKQRRSVVQITALIGLMVTTGLISQSQAQDWNKAAFDGKSLDDVMKALGASGFEKSNAITLNAPDIAENGAVVPVGVVTSLKATQMAILVEKNPSALAAQFFFPEGAQPFVTTRVKMAQSSNVYGLVKYDLNNCEVTWWLVKLLTRPET